MDKKIKNKLIRLIKVQIKIQLDYRKEKKFYQVMMLNLKNNLKNYKIQNQEYKIRFNKVIYKVFLKYLENN